MPSSNDQAARSWRQSFSALTVTEFRWLLGSNAAFFLAMQGQVLTRTFLAWELTQQEMALAYINVAFAVPMVVFSLIGGALSDRVERRKLIMTGQIAIIINEAIVLLLLLLGQLEFWHLLVAGTVGGTVIPFIMPARSAIVFKVVGAARLGNAMAISSGVINLSRVLGPAMMGTAISFFSTPGAYAIAVALFIVSVLCMFGVRPHAVDENDSKPRLSQDVVRGITYIVGHRPLFLCLLFGLIPMFLAMPFQNLLVVFADEVWQVGEQGLGTLMAISGLGGVMGSIWVARRGEQTDRVKLMAISTLLFGVLLMVFSMTEQFYWALLPLFLANACASASQTLNNTAAQLLVDDNQRGRMSAFMMMTFGLTPLGVLPLAYFAQIIGADWSTFAACALMSVIVVIFYLSSSTLRQLDNSVEQALDSQLVKNAKIEPQ